MKAFSVYFIFAGWILSSSGTVLNIQRIYSTLFSYKNIDFGNEAGYSYILADFRLSMFL